MTRDMLPGDYAEPRVGDQDLVGDWSERSHNTCGHELPGQGWICTLPRGHKCWFHVAHGANSEVLQVHRRRIPKHLKLPEGF